MTSKRKIRKLEPENASVKSDEIVRLTADRAYRVPNEHTGHRIGPFRLEEVTRNGKPLKLDEKKKL
jgi:hypothetical protein